MIRIVMLLTLLGFQPFASLQGTAVAAELGENESAPGLEELTPEELQNYEFDVEPVNATVEDLSLGQRYALSTQRRELHDLIARTLGILELKESVSDLQVLQNLVNKRVILDSDVRTWQSFGIVFGDVLAAEFDLDWVSYEDDLGAAKALRWRDTDNYVFPVTMFSKRVQFKERIDVQMVFNEIGADIDSFKAFERNRPVFKSDD